jgi:hypothetical protein
MNGHDANIDCALKSSEPEIQQMLRDGKLTFKELKWVLSAIRTEKSVREKKAKKMEKVAGKKKADSKWLQLPSIVKDKPPSPVKLFLSAAEDKAKWVAKVGVKRRRARKINQHEYTLMDPAHLTRDDKIGLYCRLQGLQGELEPFNHTIVIPKPNEASRSSWIISLDGQTFVLPEKHLLWENITQGPDGRVHQMPPDKHRRFVHKHASTKHEAILLRGGKRAVIAAWVVGDAVIVVKKGNMYNERATVCNADWEGRVQVKMNSDSSLKSYMANELRASVSKTSSPKKGRSHKKSMHSPATSATSATSASTPTIRLLEKLPSFPSAQDQQAFLAYRDSARTNVRDSYAIRSGSSAISTGSPIGSGNVSTAQLKTSLKEQKQGEIEQKQKARDSLKAQRREEREQRRGEREQKQKTLERKQKARAHREQQEATVPLKETEARALRRRMERLAAAGRPPLRVTTGA